MCDSPSGLTAHTEVVRVVFSPQDISLEELLRQFWENHDPTQGRMSAHPNKPQSPSKKEPSQGGESVLEQKGDAQACARACCSGGKVSWVQVNARQC